MSSGTRKADVLSAFRFAVDAFAQRSVFRVCGERWKSLQSESSTNSEFRARGEWPVSGLGLHHPEGWTKVRNGPGMTPRSRQFLENAAIDLTAVERPKLHVIAVQRMTAL